MCAPRHDVLEVFQDRQRQANQKAGCPLRAKAPPFAPERRLRPERGLTQGNAPPSLKKRLKSPRFRVGQRAGCVMEQAFGQGEGCSETFGRLPGTLASTPALAGAAAAETGDKRSRRGCAIRNPFGRWPYPRRRPSGCSAEAFRLLDLQGLITAALSTRTASACKQPKFFDHLAGGGEGRRLGGLPGIQGLHTFKPALN